MRWWVGDHLWAKMATGAALRQRCPLTHSPNTHLKGKEQQAALQTAAMPLGARWPMKDASKGDACRHRSPSRPLVAPARHHNHPRPHPCPHGCGGRNGPAIPRGKLIPTRMGVNFQHSRPFPPVHEFPTDAAQTQAPHGAGRARFPSRGHRSKFPLISPPSRIIPQIKTPCAGLCRLWAVL